MKKNKLLKNKTSMIKEILFTGFIIISTFGFGQTNFSKIDKNSKTVPLEHQSYKEIADYLTKELDTDIEKARAVYIWLAHNIQYDLGQINSTRRYGSSKEIIDEALATKKGVCQHYSELFLAMSKYVGLKTYLISGYTRDAFGEIAPLNHAWNAIQIDTDYYLIDVTWAAGYELNGKYIHKFRDDYFLKPPREFIVTHMPFDPIWQFIDSPINNNDFISKDFSKIDSIGYFSFSDSIAVYERSNRLTQLENTNRRVIDCGVENTLIQNYVNENMLQISNTKYNLAIDTLNYGIENYNLYISCKNKQFRSPKLEDAQIKELINNADNGINTANDMFYGLTSNNSELNSMIADAREKMPSIISDLEREKNFVSRYLKKWKPLRIFMFYTFAY